MNLLDDLEKRIRKDIEERIYKSKPLFISMRLRPCFVVNDDDVFEYRLSKFGRVFGEEKGV